MKHYLSGLEFSPAETEALLDHALRLKQSPQTFATALSGYSIVGLFEKPSLRTRVSFEVGLHRLGAQAVYLDHQQERIGQREAIKDYAQNLSVWTHGIFARVFNHQTLIDLAQYSKVPVVNALCQHYHPCQALADALTIKEIYGQVKDVRVAYVGDGNNVCHSLMLIVAALGGHISVATPASNAPQDAMIEQAKSLSKLSGGSVNVVNDTKKLTQQDVLYTDTWISMGSTANKDEVYQRLAPFQINAALVEQTQTSAVLHCQPAHRDVEISSELMDAPYSYVLQQAENRLHAQNALWLKLFNKI
jgi:ornithine carbamoyltransferase